MKLRAAFSIAALTLVPSSYCAAQSTPQTPLRASALDLDSLLRSPGPAWLSGRSSHFAVHVEEHSHRTVPQMLDGLEAAWRHAVTLVGAPVSATPLVQVLVTASRSRFSRLLTPQAKGLTTQMPRGGEVMILVANDSVRAYTRHEVMHVVSQRAWGSAGPSRAWLIEGLATFADGQCQGTTITAVGRDILRLEPVMTAEEVMKRFVELWQADRSRAYVLAGTLVGFLWESRGRDGVRRLWQGVDSLSQPMAFPPFGDDLTRAWHAYVRRTAGTTPGIDAVAFRRAGCG